MNLAIIIALVPVSAFAGFAVGRLGDKYAGHLNAPHHWILGIILSILGIFYIDMYLGIFFLFFGAGHFISDLDDFLHFRIWGVDIPHEWRFWSIK